MKSFHLALGTAALVLSAYAEAHPTNEAYETRGECEVAYAESSKEDRQRLVEMGVFETQGAAQRTFKDLFACEYDEEEEVWYIVFTPMG